MADYIAIHEETAWQANHLLHEHLLPPVMRSIKKSLVAARSQGKLLASIKLIL